MNTILRPIRNYPIVAFAILACLFGWVQFIAYVFGADIIPDGMPLDDHYISLSRLSGATS
jgi:hypothetical protein